MPLVCRRWRQLVHAQPLLQQAVFARSGQPELLRLRSFCEWLLLRASQHVPRLTILLDYPVAGEADETTSLAVAAATACRAGLTELHLQLRAPRPFACSSWLATLRGLRRLTIEAYHGVVVTASLQPLAALERAKLEGVPNISLLSTARLPGSLTQLYFEELGTGESLPTQVPPPHVHACRHASAASLQPRHHPDAACNPACRICMQMAALAGLHSLGLGRATMGHNGYAMLTSFSSLRQLALSSLSHLPACMSLLTGLEALSINDPGWLAQQDEDVAASMEAVGQLTNLTHLALADYVHAPGPGFLTTLSRLRSLWWLPYAQSIDAALPAGAWLANLRQLALPITQLQSNLAALASARQPQTLAIDAHAESHLLPEVLRWAARQPRLALVLLRVVDDAQLGKHFADFMEMQRSGPRLRIERHPFLNMHPHFYATDCMFPLYAWGAASTAAYAANDLAFSSKCVKQWKNTRWRLRQFNTGDKVVACCCQDTSWM